MRGVGLLLVILAVSAVLVISQSTVSNCVPTCGSDQVCEQVFNTNDQYECNTRSSSTTVANSSIVNACGSGCAQGETCQQVYNTNNQYECVATSASQNTTAQISPSATPAVDARSASGCNPSCSANETCRQVFNTDGQYECVALTSAAAVSSPAPTTAANVTVANTSTGCNPACSAGETCRQVYNTDDQYECVAIATPIAASTAANSTTAGTNASSSCDPACVAGERCRQVFNTNNQYECVATSSPTAAAATPSPSTAVEACPVDSRCTDFTHCMCHAKVAQTHLVYTQLIIQAVVPLHRINIARVFEFAAMCLAAVAVRSAAAEGTA